MCKTPGAFVLLPAGEPHTFLAGNREPLHALQSPIQIEHFAAAAGNPATQRRLPDPAPLDQPALGHTATLHGMQILARHHTTDTKPRASLGSIRRKLAPSGTAARIDGLLPLHGRTRTRASDCTSADPSALDGSPRSADLETRPRKDPHSRVPTARTWTLRATTSADLAAGGS